jgi:hypothetical protein
VRLAKYLSRSAEIATAIATLGLSRLAPFQYRPLTPLGYTGLVSAIADDVRDYRWESASLARDYFDAERSLRLGDGASRHDVWLEADYSPLDLLGAVEDLRDDLMSDDTSTGTISRFAAEAAKATDDAGRLTLREAAETDPECLGWARVGDGDSCAFCLTMISRGPVYGTAESAGLRNAYHPACGCRAVPVYDRDDWPGRDQYIEAERLYREASRQPGSTIKNLRKNLNDNRS